MDYYKNNISKKYDIIDYLIYIISYYYDIYLSDIEIENIKNQL
jgi:hypothetical protein